MQAFDTEIAVIAGQNGAVCTDG